MNYTFKLIREFIFRFRGILAIGVIIGIVAFVGINFISPLLFSEHQAEKIGVTGRYTPDTLPSSVLKDIGQGLTVLDESGIAKPALASSWEYKDDGKTWIFHLDTNKKWQDGSPLTAADIKYNFQDVAITSPDAKTVVFRLKTSFSPFPIVVSKPAFKKGLLGTDKWKVANLSLTGGYVQKISLKDNSGNQKIYNFYPTEERTKLAYKLGEINKLADLIDPYPFNAWNNSKVERSLNKERFVAVFFNTQDKLLSDKTIRQALSYAINKSDFTASRAYGPISPNSWAYNPQIKTYDFDPEKVKDLTDTTITLSTPPALLDLANKIKSNWDAVGVKTQIQVVPVKPDNYQAYLIIHDIPSDPDQYSMWHSTEEATNISKYKSPRIDKLLEDGRTELNSDNRKKIYLDFQRFLLEDAPAAFLYHPISYTISRK